MEGEKKSKQATVQTWHLYLLLQQSWLQGEGALKRYDKYKGIIFSNLDAEQKLI